MGFGGIPSVRVNVSILDSRRLSSKTSDEMSRRLHWINNNYNNNEQKFLMMCGQHSEYTKFNLNKHN